MENAAAGRHHSRKKQDLTGQRYGSLTVIAPAENVGGRTAWLCRCDCGSEVIVKSVKLREGVTRSCGCARHTIKSSSGKVIMDIKSVLTLVDGTCVEMLRNKTPRSNNTSGVVGVEWRKRDKTWRATICFKGKRHYLGSYKRFEDAVSARKRAEEQYHQTFLDEYDRKQAGSAQAV